MKPHVFFCSLFLLGVTTVQADLYQWTDEQGVTHVVDDTGSIPEAYRDKIKTHRTAKPTPSQASLLAPSRTYPENSQGAFVQKLALDLGLIKHSGEDALGPLGTVGIQPAGGWRVYDPLTPEVRAEVATAARRAADSQRIRVSADGAEAIVRQTATAFLPPPPVTQIPDLPEQYEVDYDQEPEVIVEQQPPQIIEVIREPYYVPVPVIVERSHGHRRDHKHRRSDREERGRQRNQQDDSPRGSSGFSAQRRRICRLEPAICRLGLVICHSAQTAAHASKRTSIEPSKRLSHLVIEPLDH